jgi:hypothetical protein
MLALSLCSRGITNKFLERDSSNLKFLHVQDFFGESPSLMLRH